MRQCFTQTRKRRTKVGHKPPHTFIIPIGRRKKLEVWYSFGENPKVRFSFFFCKFPENDEPYMYRVRHFDIGWKDMPQVVQLVEPQIVALVVEGSIPSLRPIKNLVTISLINKSGNIVWL